MNTLNIESLSKIGGPQIYLRDDGLGNDSMANDGIYTGTFSDTQYEGSYTFRFRARGENNDGVTFDRTETLSEYVKFAASPEETDVEWVSVVTDQQEKIVRATIKVTPRDVFGSYLGPFRGDLIRVWSSSGNVMPEYEDNQDGSYNFRLTYPIDEKPRISVSIDDVLVADRKEMKAFPFSLSLHVGSTIPTGNFNNNYDANYMLGLNLDYHFTPQFSLLGFLGYNRFQSGSPSVNDTYWWNLSANLKYEFVTYSLRPYINGGLGLYIPETGSTEPGFNVGLGIDYSLSPNWILESGGDYHCVFTSGDDVEFFVSYIGLIYRF
jgi:hypothetical protein